MKEKNSEGGRQAARTIFSARTERPHRALSGGLPITAAVVATAVSVGIGGSGSDGSSAGNATVSARG